jgi:predicted TIM-barrel fold metal-dependent hydrolase
MKKYYALIWALCLLLQTSYSQAFLINWLGGASEHSPDELSSLSVEAQALVKSAFNEIPDGTYRDVHTHIVGMGTNGTGTWLNPKLTSLLHPIHRFKTAIYLSGADITDKEEADKQYIERLLSLSKNFGGDAKFHILAFDYHYNEDGTINYEKSEFYTPNQYVVDLAKQYPELFIPTISVHPYRTDWKDELKKYSAMGVRYIKWLPNAQGIDAQNPKLDEYYQFLIEHNMVLLTHVGEEKAVEAEEDQKLGNPLRFRRPLDMGVKVIMAHSASLGENEDFDSPSKKTSSFNLFWRMMKDKKYEGLLFGELSAITQSNRIPGPITTILANPDMHHRFVNGSDYPLPAINAVISTRKLVKAGLISKEEQKLLKEIYHYNPILFDFVLKRSLRHPETGEKLSPSIFQLNKDI